MISRLNGLIYMHALFTNITVIHNKALKEGAERKRVRLFQIFINKFMLVQFFMAILLN